MKDYLDNTPMWFRAKNKIGNLQFFFLNSKVPYVIALVSFSSRGHLSI